MLLLAVQMLSPWQTVQLTGGEFIICHGRTNDPDHRVCHVDSDGCVLSSYGGSMGSGTQQMNVPAHVAVARNNGFVYVVDHHNYRVLLLSPALNYVREVPTCDLIMHIIVLPV